MTLENKKYTSEIHKRAFNETTKKLYDEKFSSSDKKITVKKYYGGGWATEKMSDNTESSFTNFDDYFKYILNSIEPNEFTQAYWKDINPTFQSIKSNLTTAISLLDRIIDDNSYNSYFPSFYSYIRQMYQYIIVYDVIFRDSFLFKILLKNRADGKSVEFLRGIIGFFKTTPLGSNTNIRKDDDSILGYMHMYSIENPFSFAASSPEFKKLLRTSTEINEKQKEVLEKSEEEVSKLINDAIKKFNERDEEFNKTIQKKQADIDAARRGLMLSVPVKYWHDQLTIYTGTQYELPAGEQYKYVPVKKDSCKEKFKFGKTKNYLILSVFWAIFCLGAIGVGVWQIFENTNSNDTKLAIIISSITAFGLFISGYILRIFIKNWNTSRHIEESIRDRIALTLVYISMKQEGILDEDSEGVIISEIFRRVETGLIKESGNSPVIEMISKKI